MNDNRRDQKPEGGIARLVIFGIVMLIVFIEAIGLDGGSVFFIILMVGGIALAVFAMKKQQAEEKKNGAADAAAQPERAEPMKREFKPQHFDMSKFVGKRAEGESLSKRLTELMRDNTDDCDDDHVHIEPSINADPNEKRAAQLREMLRNGIIEKDEYNILMRKFGLK